MKKTVINLSRANFLLDLFTFFFKRQLSIFFNLHFSFVHFIGGFYRQERRFAEFASILPRYLSFLACTHEQMVDGYLINQSARFTFVMLYNMFSVGVNRAFKICLGIRDPYVTGDSKFRTRATHSPV